MIYKKKNLHFSILKITDYGRTNGRTDPLIEMRGRKNAKTGQIQNAVPQYIPYDGKKGHASRAHACSTLYSKHKMGPKELKRDDTRSFLGGHGPTRILPVFLEKLSTRPKAVSARTRRALCATDIFT